MVLILVFFSRQGVGRSRVRGCAQCVKPLWCCVSLGGWSTGQVRTHIYLEISMSRGNLPPGGKTTRGTFLWVNQSPR